MKVICLSRLANSRGMKPERIECSFGKVKLLWYQNRTTNKLNQAMAKQNKQREEFEVWLFDMDNELEVFLSEVPPDLKKKLDYSAKSLDALEEWMLTKYGSVEDIMKKTEKTTLDRIARYIGETVRRNYSLIWDIELEDPDD